MTSPQETPTAQPARRRLEQASHVSQVIASIAVVISLVYVGLQLQQTTAQLKRGENNATLTQFQAIRLSIIENREVADLLTRALYGRLPLDPADQLRLETFLSEFTWSTFHIWDRARNGLLDKEEFTRGGAPNLARMLCTQHGGAWWMRDKAQYAEGFVQDVDKAIGSLPREQCPDASTVTPGLWKGEPKGG